MNYLFRVTAFLMMVSLRELHRKVATLRQSGQWYNFIRNEFITVIKEHI